MLKLRLQCFGHLMFRANSLKKTLMLGKTEGRRRRIGWDGWMASPTQWTWVWARSGRWWKSGRPGVLQSMGHKESDTTEQLKSNSKGMGSSPGTSFGSGREEVNECWLVIYDGQRMVVTFLRREGRHSLRTRLCRLRAKHTPHSASLAPQQPVRLVLSVIPFCRWKCKMELPKGRGQSTWVKVAELIQMKALHS